MGIGVGAFVPSPIFFGGRGLMSRYEAGVRSDGGSFAFPIDTGLASRLEGLGLLNASSLVNSCNAGKESVLYNLIPTPVQALDRFAVTRSTVKWVLGANGLLREIPANTPAFEYNTDGTYKGLLVEPAGMNGVRNNTMVGAVVGSPGTLPTNWNEALGGLTRQVVGFGTEAGIEYIDIRLSGTATVAQANIRPESTTDIVASTGQTWSNSWWVKKIAEPTPPNAYQILTIERTAAGGGVTEGGIAILPTTTEFTRFTQTRTLSGGGTVARVQPAINFTLTIGLAYDFTVRVGLPQMEQSSVATSVIKTSGTSLTRTADSVTLTGASSLIGQTEGTLYAEAETRLVGGAGLKPILTLSDGTDTNRIIITKSANDANQAIVTATTDQASISSASNQSGVARYALAYASNDFAFYVNGVQIGTDASGTVPATNRIDIGQRGTGATFLNGWIRSVVLFPTRLPNATLAFLTA